MVFRVLIGTIQYGYDFVLMFGLWFFFLKGIEQDSSIRTQARATTQTQDVIDEK